MLNPITLPYPPSVNQYWGHKVIHARTGRSFVQVYVKHRGKRFQEDVSVIVGDHFASPTTLTDRLCVNVEVFPPDKRKRDLDNILKATLDALTQARLWKDDELIDTLIVHRREIDRPDGHVVVHVTSHKSEGGGHARHTD